MATTSTRSEAKPKNKSFFAKIGIIGWEDIEPVIISSLLSNKAVMFEGLHGTAKTLICELISKSFLPGANKFRYFNCPIATQDELLGFMDLGALQKGQVKYIDIPSSVWGGNSVLMDEINRAAFGMQGKFMELALSGTVNGQKTGINFRFAAVNPPDQYLTTPMDMALLSRFVTVKVPSLAEIVQKDRNNATAIAKANLVPANFTASWKKMKATKLDKEIDSLIGMTAEEVIVQLTNSTGTVSGINFSGRQANDLYKLYRGFYQYFKFTKQDWDQDKIAEVMTTITIGLIPECSDLVDSNLLADRETVSTLIKETILGIFNNIQSLQSQKELTALMADDNLDPEGFERLKSIITPEAWRSIRNESPNNKTWKRINSIMASRSLEGYIDLSNVTTINNSLENY